MKSMKSLRCKIQLAAVALAIAAAISGCSADEKVPPANDTTCQPNFIKTLKTEKAQKALGTACATRGKYNLAPGKAW